MWQSDALDDPVFTKQGLRIRVAYKESQRLMAIKYWVMAGYDHSSEITAVELYAQNNK